MWNRLRNVALLLIDAVVALVVIVLCIAYVGICSLITASVVNDLRLDTYIDFDTGFGIVSLVLLLVWIPVWGLREIGRRR
jgi:hypothetical protein